MSGEKISNKKRVRVKVVANSETRLIHGNSAAVNYFRPGETLCKEELLLPRENTLLEQVVAITSLFCFFGLFYTLPLIFLYLLAITVLCGSGWGAVAVAAFVLEVALPPGKEWQSFRNWWLWDVWRRYFRLCIVLPELPFLDQTKRYLLAQFPHATFPMAAFLTPVLAGAPATGVPAPMAGVIASVLLKVPVFKHIFAWSACHPATQANLLGLLATTSVGMIPEGVAGIFEGANPDRERIYAKSRRGFIRVAILSGRDIIPVYHFGNSQLFRSSGSEFLSRKLRTTLGVFWGRLGLAPHPQRLVTVVGRPVKVMQNDNPTEEQVQETHARFLASLKELYNQHRHLCDYSPGSLEIV